MGIADVGLEILRRPKRVCAGVGALSACGHSAPCVSLCFCCSLAYATYQPTQNPLFSLKCHCLPTAPQLNATYLAATDPDEKERALLALAYSGPGGHVTHTLEFALSGAVRAQVRAVGSFWGWI